MQRRRAIRLLLGLAVAVVSAGDAPPLAAQSRPVRLEVELPSQPGREPPRVRAVGVLDDGRLRDLLRNGFPTRFRFRAELWSTGGWFNNLEGAAEWDVVVRHDPLGGAYDVVRIVNDRPTLLGRYADPAQAQAAAERPYSPTIRIPRTGRRYYYNARVDVEAMSLSDLDEVERWLRGELRPAVRGERNPGTALGRGVGQLLVRLAGGERRQLEARSRTFVAN